MYKCSEVSLNVSSLIDFIKNFFIIAGGAIALASYRSQNRQRAIDNSFKSLNVFEKTIQIKDIEVWRNIYFNTYESTGAKPNHFILFSKENSIRQVPLTDLFISEGRGLYVLESKFGRDEKAMDIELGSIRRIAEQLDLIGYKVLYGNIELRIIYYELGQIIETIYKWQNQSQNEYTKSSEHFMFPYFMKMCRKHQKMMTKLPRKSYVEFD